METKSNRWVVWRNANTATAGMPLSSGCVWVEEQAAGSWRTTQGGRQSPLEEHGLATVGAERRGMYKFGRQWFALRSWIGRFKMLLQGKQARSDRRAKETKIAHFYKASGQDMLEKALHEFLGREGTLFELPGVGGAVLEGDLGRFHPARVFHPHQAAIAESHPVDIGSQIAESGLSVAHGFAMDHPVLLPNVGRDLWKEGSFLQQMLEGGTK